jgi:short-subunit dehydrogenase
MLQTNYHNQIVWIIGASSGIGAALAAELSGRGATLALSARRKEQLDALNSTLDNKHRVYVLDVADTELVERTSHAIRAAMGRIDRIIFLAAAYTPMSLDKIDLVVTKQMIDVNLLSAFNLIAASLPILKTQGYGQITLCGSIAGYTGLPNGQPYSATKAAIINLAESLRAEMNGKIDVKLLSPGFVESELTQKNDFEMPMIISAEQAATYIADGLLTKKFEIHFPKKFTIWLKLIRLLPYSIAFNITKTFKK